MIGTKVVEKFFFHETTFPSLRFFPYFMILVLHHSAVLCFCQPEVPLKANLSQFWLSCLEFVNSRECSGKLHKKCSILRMFFMMIKLSFINILFFLFLAWLLLIIARTKWNIYQLPPQHFSTLKNIWEKNVRRIASSETHLPIHSFCRNSGEREWHNTGGHRTGDRFGNRLWCSTVTMHTALEGQSHKYTCSYYFDIRDKQNKRKEKHVQALVK